MGLLKRIFAKRPAVEGVTMRQPHRHSGREQIVDTMIGLTRLSDRQRAIVTGSDGLDLCLALRRRGLPYVATTATCRMPKRRYDVGLITGQISFQATEAALANISQYLATNATIAILIDNRESGFCMKVRVKLEQMGFRIEAGVRCQDGFVLSASRSRVGQMNRAA